jgi:hypothetical protein
MITGYKSIKSIMAGLYRDLGYNTEINFSDVIEWVGEALGMIGAYGQYLEKQECIEICNHEAILPCDFYKLIDVSYNGSPIRWATNTLISLYGCEGCKIPTCCTDEYFYISESTIKTSFKEGKLCLLYLAVATDEDGYPLIPDDVYFDKALKAYCTYMLDRIEFRKQRLSETAYRDSEKDWLWYVNSARGAANMPNTHQLERLKNVMVRLIPKQNEFNKFFMNNANQERRRTF